MNKIIQTPSHLGLFEKDTNIRPANIRESMTTNVNRKELTTRFFSKNNQTMLKNEIKKHVAVKTVHDEEHVKKRQHVLEPGGDRTGIGCVVGKVVGHHKQCGQQTPRAKQPIVLSHDYPGDPILIEKGQIE